MSFLSSSKLELASINLSLIVDQSFRPNWYVCMCSKVFCLRVSTNEMKLFEESKPCQSKPNPNFNS